MLGNQEMLRVIRYGVKSFTQADLENILSSQRELLKSCQLEGELENNALERILAADIDISPEERSFFISILLQTLQQEVYDPSQNYLRIMPIDPSYNSNLSIRMRESSIVLGNSILHVPKTALYLMRAIFDLPGNCDNQYTIMRTSLPNYADKVAAIGVNFMPLLTKHPQLYCLCPRVEAQALYEIMSEM